MTIYYELKIYPVPALTYLALIPPSNAALPLVFAPIQDRQIRPWRTAPDRRTFSGQAYLQLTFNGMRRKALFEPMTTPDGTFPKALTDALPGARTSQIVRAVRGPAADTLGRHMATRADLVPAQHDTDWRIYQLVNAPDQPSATTATPGVTPGVTPRATHRPAAVWL